MSDLTQLRDYCDYLDEVQGEIDLIDIVPAVRPIDGFARVPPKPRGWLVAVAAAGVMLMLAAGIAWLTRPTSSGLVVEPSATVPDAPTTTEIEIEGFAPSVSGLGLDEGEWNAFRLDSHEYEFGAVTLAAWEANWGLDWLGIVESVVDENTRLRMANQPFATRNLVDYRWLPEEGIFDFRWGESDKSFARLALSFTGTSSDWAIEVSDGATGVSLGFVEGSLPGLQEDELMDRIVLGGRVGWFFVSEGGETIQVAPPWESYFEEREHAEFVVVRDTIVAFVVTDPRGPGQMTMWNSTDGHAWKNLGPTPWPGNSYALDTLIERDGELLARVVGGDEGMFERDGDLPPRILYWTSPDGAVWTELTEQEWELKSGGVGPPPSYPPAFEVTPSVVAYFDGETQNGTVISSDPLVIQPARGPEPRFDTSRLGREIALTPAAPGTKVIERLRGELDWSDPHSTAIDPILYIARLDDPFDTEFVVWITPMGGLCEAFLGRSATCSSPGELNLDDPIRWNAPSGLVVVKVERDASVVTIASGNTEPMWQRPIGGWALFPAVLDATTTFTLKIYNEAGTTLGSHSR